MLAASEWGIWNDLSYTYSENNMENKMSGENHNFFDGVFIESNAIGSF